MKALKKKSIADETEWCWPRIRRRVGFAIRFPSLRDYGHDCGRQGDCGPLAHLLDSAASSSPDYYGMFWGTSTILCPVLLLLLYRDITHLAQITFYPGIRQTEYVRYICPFILASPIVFCAPVTIYFGVKFSLPTPSIFLLPAKLLCCCSEKRARTLVLSVTLWFDLVATNFVLGHIVYVLRVFRMTPYSVAVNVMLLVLTFMCLTNAMPLLFTVCAFIGPRKCLRSSADCVSIVRAATLIPILLAIIGFSFGDGLRSQFVNTATQQNSFYQFFSPLFTPALLGAMVLNLKKFVSVWMHWSPGGEEGGNTVSPLHGHTYNCIHRCELPTINRCRLTDNHYMLTEIIHK